LRLFELAKQARKDPIIGSAVAGRYHVTKLVHKDDFSRLYVGTDITDQSRIGVRVAHDVRSHAKMLQWLSRAMLSRLGKYAILAIGHFEQDHVMYVVLAEAALDIARKVPQPASVYDFVDYEARAAEIEAERELQEEEQN
jgi:hypothetical protein